MLFADKCLNLKMCVHFERTGRMAEKTQNLARFNIVHSRSHSFYNYFSSLVSSQPMFAFFRFMDTCNISIRYLAIFEMFSIAVDWFGFKIIRLFLISSRASANSSMGYDPLLLESKKTPAPTRKPNQIITNTQKKNTKTYTNKQNLDVERSRSMCKTDKSKEPRELQERKICRMSQFRFYF